MEVVLDLVLTVALAAVLILSLVVLLLPVFAIDLYDGLRERRRRRRISRLT